VKLAINPKMTVGIGTTAVLMGAVAWFTLPYGTSYAHPTYAVSLSTAEQAAGWADDIFVATVKDQASVERTSDDLLWTTYDVDVKETLKGKVNSTVRVAQEGGDDPVARERVMVGDSPSLVPGKTYILATRVTSDGWHHAPSNFTPVELSAADAKSRMSEASGDPTLQDWKAALRHPAVQTNLQPSEAAAISDSSALYSKAQVD